ncbi:MAG: MotB family protein [Notoacmeibacter sp.]
MSDGAQKQHTEIIIIKRKKSGGHDAHHGGAWKIAYADFVTAMMAFFLVMWLINASNEETKAAVASYFNPVQLMDTTSNPKGIKNAQYGASSKDSPTEKPRARSDARPAEGEEIAQTEIDDTIFRDPYAILTEIAGGAGQSEGGDVSETPLNEDSLPRPGLLGGEAYRDPFEPEFWAARKDQLPERSDKTEMSSRPEGEEMVQSDSANIEPAPLPQPVPVPVPVPEPEPVLDPAPEPEPVPEPDQNPANPQVESQNSQIKEAEKIAAELKEAIGSAVKASPQFSVEAGEGGVTINLTDGADFSMFEIGSAKPKREVIELVAKIAAVLNSKPGTIEIAGHTDARPFKSTAYDNWRLSSARAQMAYYMLVRAGVGTDRFGAIIGHASAKPRIADNPIAAENRRIEIRLITLPGQKS